MISAPPTSKAPGIVISNNEDEGVRGIPSKTSSINLLAIQLLEDHTGLTIAFVQWMVVGILLNILIIPMAWFLIMKVYKPAEIDSDMVRNFIDGLKVPSKVGNDEKKVLAITAAMLVLWILSSWIRGINVMVVAILGTCVFLLPKIGVIKWETFVKNVNFDPFFLN